MKKLPYSTAKSNEQSLGQIKEALKDLGCSSFVAGDNFEDRTIFIQFSFQETTIRISMSPDGYAERWILENPFTNRKQCTEEEYGERALDIGCNAIYPIIRDYILANLTLIDLGTKTFEGAFRDDIISPRKEAVLLTHASDKD